MLITNEVAHALTTCHLLTYPRAHLRTRVLLRTNLPRPGRLALGVALRGAQAARAQLPAMRGAAVRRWPSDGKGPLQLCPCSPNEGVCLRRGAGFIDRVVERWSGGAVVCGARWGACGVGVEAHSEGGAARVGVKYACGV